MSQTDQQPAAPPPRARRLRHCVSFSLSAGRYCIPVEQVLQILRRDNLIGIPTPPPSVEGVINLRGDIIPVIDLRERLQVPAPEAGGEPDPQRRRVIIVRIGAHSYGLDVDDVREIVDFDDGELDSGPEAGSGGPFVLGTIERPDAVHAMLDLPRMFDSLRDAPRHGGDP